MDTKDKLELYKLAVEMVDRRGGTDFPGDHPEWKKQVEKRYNILCDHFDELKGRDKPKKTAEAY